MFGNTRTLEVYQGKPLQGYAGHEVQLIGPVEVDVEYGHQKKQLPLILVAGNERPPLFGRNWMQGIQLDWAKLHQIRQKATASIVSRFPAVFSAEVGKIRAVIRLKEGTKSIFKKSRSVAYALQPALEVELTRMQQEGIPELVLFQFPFAIIVPVPVLEVELVLF